MIFLLSFSLVFAQEFRDTMEGSENCYDSDGGKDYYVKGFVEEGAEETGIGTNWDECEVDGSLSELYCEDGVSKTTIYNCFGGCDDGACSKCAEGARQENMYCTPEKVWLTQKESGNSCKNNYECVSENCSNSSCQGFFGMYGLYIILGAGFLILLIIIIFLLRRKSNATQSA